MYQKLLPQLALLVLVLLCSLQPGMPQDSQANTLAHIEANLVRLNSKVWSMHDGIVQSIAEVKNDIDSLGEDLNVLNESVSEINMVLQEHKQHTARQLAKHTQQLNIKIEALALNSSQQKQQLTQLQNSLDSKLDIVQNTQNSTHSKLDSLATTTAQLQKTHDDETKLTRPYTCGGTGGWRRVVHLDMTNPNTTCPSGWNMTGYSKRTCGRATDGTNTRDSAIFPVSGGEYSRVCGRIRGYQWGSTDGFAAYSINTVPTINDAYIDGVSVTHGTPRTHIWTYVAGITEGYPTWNNACPCDASVDITVPSFVGDDYFCESGIKGDWYFKFYPNDTLWDGEDCLNSTCCSQRNPPYFIKQLPTSTTDDIEARICLDEPLSNEDIAVELVELYVQ